MSEELLQTVPQQIGKYTYYRLGSTTLNQLRTAGIIPKKEYEALSANKPDGLVVYHGRVVAVVEYKQPKHLKSEKDIQKAIKQEIGVAKALCKLLIVTDSTKSFWINAANGESIRDAAGKELKTVFHPFAVKHTAAIESLLDEIEGSITPNNSDIKAAKIIDPSPLAARLWQTIWVATGKSPVKCLYNVVELFIFKFLSDLGVLPEDIAFQNIYLKSKADAEDALDFYARNTRPRIVKLFPHAKDGTTIINGTIFVSESGEANLSQSILFQRALAHLYDYSQEVGSLTKIDKQFKTKLYESFLKQEVQALGQHFTPRKVVQSVIRMAGIDAPTFQFAGKRLCDPFCGVGGFPLEILNMNEAMRAAYAPDPKGKIHVPFTLHGFDKGFERDDERTIILAKANMLIYLAELLFSNPNCSVEFARIFNDTFRLFKDNLGTFGFIIEDAADRYDYIFSNPPYVTSGSSIIKEEIQRTPRTANQYPINSLGLEGLSMEWIVRSLSPGGKAFLIIPDGILGRVGGKKLRNYLLSECYIDAIVSLPVRTFFANWEHTYILAITRKHSTSDQQTDPVFTYLVSDIGERLTSVKREEIEADDLPEMETLFRIFIGSKSVSKGILEAQSARCKIQAIKRFYDEPHWVIDRWWSKKELRTIAATGTETTTSGADVEQLLSQFQEALKEYKDGISHAGEGISNYIEVGLGDTSLFKLSIGDRVLKSDTTKDNVGVPVYSANPRKPMGYIKKSNLTDFTRPSILWGIDGNFEFNHIPPGTEFATTDHCGMIRILNEEILPEFLLFALDAQRREETFNRSFRASLANMRRFQVRVPATADGKFDLAAQSLIAGRFGEIQERREKLDAAKRVFEESYKQYMVDLSI
ncbi:MAG: SAM-dependent DNA methyltransferase [Mesorhizobium sp.]|nr:MAG: SAM-dependent DNA methyltransferase [Mesorhizobium sp.]TJV55695.1 MAG: N-6 DNA methylase [Mesorhizobium sp.]